MNDIRCIYRLKALNASENRLTHLPKSARNLRNLKYLVLQGNSFTDIEDDIAKIPYLKYLNMSRNMMKVW